MDEDEWDLQSPIGQIIKKINVIYKKPQIDNQLGEALDLFNDHISEQQRYLSNGIFKTNFAEAALFLQSCAELYGKKVDLLWDEQISYLTRLIQYDCEHDKEQGQEINKDVITKLIERRNKFKRKRKNKKVDEETKKLEVFLNSTQAPNQSSEEVPQAPNQSSGEVPVSSDTLVVEDALSSIVGTNTIEQQHENSEITQIPGWNDIQCLFEQIDERQLPDKNNLLAILKVCAYGRMRFLQEKKLPLNTTYNSYKEEYVNFRNKFFEEAAKKWDNVTLDTFEDLHKVLMYLAQKEKKKSSENASLNIHDIFPVSSTPENNTEAVTKDLEHSDKALSQPPIIPLKDSEAVDKYLEHSDDDSLFELSFICDENNKSDKNILVHLEQLSSDIVNNKLRQDSGFYEFNSDDSCDSIANRNLAGLTSQTNIEETFLNECLANHQIALPQIIPDDQIMALDENKENQQPIEKDKQNNLDNDFDTRSIMSDHDYCHTPISAEPLRERLGKRKNAKQDSIQDIIRHGKCIACKATAKEKKTKCIQRTTFKNDKELMPPPPKKQKLSHKQIIKLLQSTVPAVKEVQFEKFFNENYQLGIGEGKPPRIYESDSSDEESDENMKSKKDTAENLELPSDSHINAENLELPNDSNINTQNLELPSDSNINAENLELPSDSQQLEEEMRNSLDGIPHLSVDSSSSENPVIVNEQEPIREFPPICESIQSFEESNNVVENHSDKEFTNHLSDNVQHVDDCIRHSDTDDTLSIYSEHSYSQPKGTSRNDSGFVDTLEEEDHLEANIETLFSQVDDIVAKNNESLSIEEEYQRLLHLLEESQKDMIDEQAGRPTESQRKKQEALELQNRVEDWRNLITPILNELDGKDFDIHEYGTKIMDEIPVNHTKKFSNIVEGMTSAEVTRYFISSLQLANTNNIEICGVKSGEISNETFEIKLLNRDRYHEHLTEYQAPSTESLMERLRRLRNENSTEKEISDRDAAFVDEQPRKKKRKVVFNSLVNNDIDKPSTSTGQSLETNLSISIRDTNNNRNKSKVNVDRNPGSSKSFVENPWKGKSIKRKSFNTQHVSFEGSQAPQSLSAQITSPRQLHRATSLSNWSQSSTSPAITQVSGTFLNEETRLDDSMLENDFQRLAEVQKLYPHYQLQSTPRNELTMTFPQKNVYSSSLGRKMLFD